MDLLQDILRGRDVAQDMRPTASPDERAVDELLIRALGTFTPRLKALLKTPYGIHALEEVPIPSGKITAEALLWPTGPKEWEGRYARPTGPRKWVMAWLSAHVQQQGQLHSVELYVGEERGHVPIHITASQFARRRKRTGGATLLKEAIGQPWRVNPGSVGAEDAIASVRALLEGVLTQENLRALGNQLETPLKKGCTEEELTTCESCPS